MILGAMALLSGCASVGACSAVGYGYSGPAVLRFADPVPAGLIVAACFGSSCEPADLASADRSAWEVPQAPPYLDETAATAYSQSEVTVTVRDADGSTVSRDVHDIPISTERTGVFGQCPGPFRFEPIEVDLER